MGKTKEHIPSAPFAEWLGVRLAHHTRRLEGDVQGAIRALTNECGWGHHKDGERKLYRFRKQMRSTSFGRADKKGDIQSDRCAREPVEEALHAAGVPFAHLYPEIAAAEEVLLEPDAFCATCEEWTSPIDGFCPFCDTEIAERTGQRLMGERRAA